MHMESNERGAEKHRSSEEEEVILNGVGKSEKF